jgi:hypothetical protein
MLLKKVLMRRVKLLIGALKVALSGPPLPFESGDPNLSLNA